MLRSGNPRNSRPKTRRVGHSGADDIYYSPITDDESDNELDSAETSSSAPSTPLASKPVSNYQSFHAMHTHAHPGDDDTDDEVERYAAPQSSKRDEIQSIRDAAIHTLEEYIKNCEPGCLSALSPYNPALTAKKSSIANNLLRFIKKPHSITACKTQLTQAQAENTARELEHGKVYTFFTGSRLLRALKKIEKKLDDAERNAQMPKSP